MNKTVVINSTHKH